MPKEVIHSRYEGQRVPIGEAVVDGSGAIVQQKTEALVEPFMEIGWTRDRDHVELAVLMGGDFEENLPGAENPRPGYYIQLDRNGINRAIRTLRRARDAAFGADA